MKLIVEDSEIQGGPATLKGTRVLLHQIGGLLAQVFPRKSYGKTIPTSRRK
jgi:hypothetical protein